MILLDSTQQWSSERHIFQPTLTSIHIPSSAPSKALFLQTPKDRNMAQMTKDINLECTTKTPFYIGLSEDILFKSTLTRVSSATVQMKRHSSHGIPSTENGHTVVYYTTTNRRYSHSSIQKPYDSSSTSCSTSSRSSIIGGNRRTSIQSTELIRRFSSGSTTSTVETSISSIDLQKLNNEPLLTMATTESDNIPLLTTAPTSSYAHDPGHACNTMQQSPLKNNEASSAAQPPIWVDPKRLNQNKEAYDHILNDLKERKVNTTTSTLPLLSPCTFYSSDNNRKNYSVKPLFGCDTVWQFASRWRAFKEKGNKPSQLLVNQNIYCFKQGVEPMWEDPVNEQGGSLTINSKQLDNLFEWLVCAFVGGSLYVDGVVGLIVSRRNRGDRIELWLDKTNGTEKSISDFR